MNLNQLVYPEQGRSQDFQRVGGAPKGGSRISGYRGTMEGPKAPSEEGWGLGRGAVAPPYHGCPGA